MPQSRRSSLQSNSTTAPSEPILGPFSGPWERIKPRPKSPNNKSEAQEALPKSLHEMSAFYVDLLTNSKDDERIRPARVPQIQTVEKKPEVVEHRAPGPSQGKIANASLHHPLSFASRVARGEGPSTAAAAAPTPVPVAAPVPHPRRVPESEPARRVPALRRMRAMSNLRREYKKGEEKKTEE
ncbi:hypothetical protein B0T21DRAFT_350813 [Apiosordaria backusii]|uniref:Uncharacterized protein n=1 Tax=Apiosordaria backusii TaxID=314023 RepID=A0AA40AX86_9PEZI|nr:hypothetical protein B0T21DRAFT_350813 [Apiosordaria backusii]